MAQRDLPALRRTLLQLIAPDAHDGVVAAQELSAAHWQRINIMAQQHRLQPLLQARLGNSNSAPLELREVWADAYRDSAIIALAQKAELLSLHHKFTAAGITMVALKGAYLGWYAWPDPALRPMRDIDLLLTDASQAETAWNLLRDSGWALGKPFEGDPDGKEMPELISPDGTALELHRRCWETAEEASRFMPSGYQSLATNANCARDGNPVLYPNVEDMFVHLIVHAVYSHWLDAGPLLLGDVSYLVEANDLDWENLWKRGKSEGWSAGAALVLKLVDRWWRTNLFAESQCNVDVPDEIVEAAPDLLLQDLDHRRASLLAAEWNARGGIAGRLRNYATKPQQLLEKAFTRTGELANAEIRASARNKIALRDWLSGN